MGSKFPDNANDAGLRTTLRNTVLEIWSCMCPGRHRIFIALTVTVSNWQQLKCPPWESGQTRTVRGTLIAQLQMMSSI